MSRKCNIETLQEFAINKEGLLLSAEYRDNTTKLLWQCKEGHKWESCWRDIHSNDIKLIIIPYTESHNLEQYIKDLNV